MNSNSLRASCVALCLMASCLVGIPYIYDKFLIARYIAAAIGLAILFLHSLFTKKQWLIPNSPVFLTYLLFILLCGCSILWATNTALAIYAFSTLVMGFLVTIIGYTLIRQHPVAFKKTLWYSAAIILSVYLLFTLVQLSHVENFSFRQLYHVIGINGHKNLLAIMLLMLSGFLLTSFAIFESKLPKILSIFSFALVVTLIILLKSRAVLLSVIVATLSFGIMALIHKNKMPRKVRCRPTLVISIALAFVFLTVGLRWFANHSVPHSSPQSESEHKMTSTSSLVERCLLWEKSYRIADHHPLLGCGTGNWQIHFPDAGLEGIYRADIWNVNFTKPHNEYLGVLAENGYPGLLLLLTYLCSLIILSGKAILETTDKKTFLYGALTLCLFVGCCVNAFFDFPNSRVEHLLWTGLLTAILFHYITEKKPMTRDTRHPSLSPIFLILSVMLIVIGGFVLKGERHAFALQQAMKKYDWKSMEHHCRQAISPLYTIDAVGLPLHWYQGKALKRMGNAQAIEAFRKAYHYAPYCKENLNDLGLESYHTAHQLQEAEFYLKEAIRVSPNYLYPSFNLAYTYLQENEPGKAKAVVDKIYMDEHKRDVLISDAPFFEPDNTEAIRRKIVAEYETTMKLRKAVE